MNKTLRKLLEFNRWANRRVLECLRSTGTEVEEARREAGGEPIPTDYVVYARGG